MTTAQSIGKLDLLLDKVGSPYFTDNEKLEFLNMAQLEVLSRMVPDNLGGVVNFEMDQNIFENIAPLVYNFPVSALPSTQVITRGAITTILRSQSGDNTCNLFRILDFNYFLGGASRPIKYSPYNRFLKNQDNFFKKATEAEPTYKITSEGYVISPLNTSAVIYVSAIKTPKIMTVDNSPDWSDYMMNQVIFQAVKLSGVPLHDGEMIQDMRNTGIQSAQ